MADLEQTLLTRRLTYSTAMFHFARREMDLAADPVFNAERADSRFQAALRRVGL